MLKCIREWKEKINNVSKAEPVPMEQPVYPMPKSDFAYVGCDLDKRIIRFYATEQGLKAFAVFGDYINSDIKNRYAIFVDWRFDFQEVLQWALWMTKTYKSENFDPRENDGNSHS